MSKATASVLGDLSARYNTKQPRKMLSLDGGGIRGVITLEILLKLESDLRKRLQKGNDFRLCDYFDHFTTCAVVVRCEPAGEVFHQLSL